MTETANQPARNPPGGVDAAPGTVLVVDDEEINRRLLRAALEPRGHRVVEAEDGSRALELASGPDVDLVLLDWVLPDVTGIEVCRCLKEELATAPLQILLITAMAGRANRLEGIAAGADDFLTKPVDLQELVLRVRNALRARRLFQQVQKQSLRLKELERLRDDLVHMLVHDLRSPLTTLLGNLDWADIVGGPRHGEKAEALREAREAGLLLRDMIGMVLDVSRLESGRMPLRIET